MIGVPVYRHRSNKILAKLATVAKDDPRFDGVVILSESR